MKFIQLEVEPSEIDRNVPVAAPVVGDMGLALDMLLDEMKGRSMSADPAWLASLQADTKTKNAKFAARLADAARLSPMNHWSALSVVKPVLEANPDVILVNESTVPHGRLWAWAWVLRLEPPWLPARVWLLSKAIPHSDFPAWISPQYVVINSL